MIVSHLHQFIFLKTRKTAGTSVEIALSKLCGDDDIITPITDVDEKARRDFAGRGAQNTLIPSRFLSDGLPDRQRRTNYFNHMPASLVMASLPPEVWTGYFKFSIERDPFDRAISLYHFKTSGVTPRPPIDDWILGTRGLENWPIYAIDDQIVADSVLQYEELEAGLAEVSDRIGVAIELPVRRAKGGLRTDHRPPGEVLSSDAIRRIRDQCAREIEHFGYAVPSSETVVQRSATNSGQLRRNRGRYGLELLSRRLAAVWRQDR